MDIYYARSAREDLSAFPKNIQKRIAQKMRFFAAQDNPLKFAKHLTNSDEGEFRFRVGDYRVFFDVEKNKIFILRIAKRDEAY